MAVMRDAIRSAEGAGLAEACDRVIAAAASVQRALRSGRPSEVPGLASDLVRAAAALDRSERQLAASGADTPGDGLRDASLTRAAALRVAVADLAGSALPRWLELHRKQAAGGSQAVAAIAAGSRNARIDGVRAAARLLRDGLAGDDHDDLARALERVRAVWTGAPDGR